ncbi:unnamed protein product [Peniophora sp. CBMAI 1063]|nr:unnamed protein product [Peniophora sp. CBMAI 1063]
MSTSVFLTGSTGLIGASVLQVIAKNPKYVVTVLVRSEQKAVKIAELLPGVKTVVGSLDDAALLTETAANSDVVLQIAAFHVPGTTALLAGAKKRFEATGKAPIFINTSGTGIWADLGANGAAPSRKVTKDTDSDLVQTFIELPHTPPTMVGLEAAAAGYVKVFTVYPSTVWGEPSGPLFDSGVAHVGSIQVPMLIKESIGRGQGGVVGEGLNVWNHVHIDDTTDFYIYTEILHAKGKSASSVPTQFKQEEFAANSFLFFFGTNSTTEAPRSRSIGWAPKYTTDDFYPAVPKEVDAVLAGKR